MPTDFDRGTFETILIRLLSDMQWKIVLTDKDADGNTLYIGRNTRSAAAADATDWYIWKVTNNVEQGPLTGAWNGREDLDWNRVYIGPTIPTYTVDYRLHSLIEEMILQQKITNAYLSIVSDTEIGEEDVL